MFGTDWRDPNRYDLILNMGKMRREGAKRVIIEAAKLEEYQPTPVSNRAFNDFALGSRVHATLFASRPTYEHRPSKFAPRAAIFTLRVEWIKDWNINS